MAADGKIGTLPFTHLSPGDIETLEQLVGRLPSKAVCVEVGSYLGASAVVIARSLGLGSRLYCVDTWMNDGMSEGAKDTFAEFLSNTAAHSTKVTPIRSTSVEAAKTFEGQIDFLFVDGDHSYEGCFADLEAWLPKLKDGAVVALHDFGWADGVQRAIGEKLLPVQEGPGRFLDNMYWARVKGAAAPSSKPTSLEARSAVISRDPHPPAEGAKQLAAELGGATWSWISAGLDRGTPKSRGAIAGVEVIDAGAVGLVAGRHKAMACGSEDILILLDDDVSLPPGWLDKMLEPFASPEVHFVGCRYLPQYELAPPSWMEGLWLERDDGFRSLGQLSLLDGGELGRPYSPMLVWGLCFAARRETIIKLGGFNPDGYPWALRRFRGDGENGLALKAEVLGLKAFYQGETHVLHHVPAERMTPQYFEQRSFLQGISDSYSQIRRTRTLPQAPPRSWKDALRPTKWRVQRAAILIHPTTAGVRRLMNRAQFDGMRFHEQQCREDPSLLEWVLKPDYLDYQLPEGWERHLLGTG